MTEYLIRLLNDRYKIATLSRGYKRKSKGFRIANGKDNAVSIGDEPYQFFRKFGDKVTVAVGEDRVYAIPHLLYKNPAIQCILLDDAYQQLQIRPTLQILLIDFNRPIYRDLVFPAGYLREPRKAAKRADIVVVTKCPENITEVELSEVKGRMRPYISDHAHVFFSFIHYDKLQPVWDRDLRMGKNIILITAIANPAPLVEHLNREYHVLKHFKFPDHHYFSAGDLKRVIRFFKRSDESEKVILFTEKDMVKLCDTPLEDILKPYPVFFQQITYNFVSNGPDFDKLIITSVKNQAKQN
jgi:tetraacyldisaccharide 4'-kinase